MSYFVYILECENGAFYTGYTTDLERRYEEHCSGSRKCKYTRSFPPKNIAVCWELNNSLSIVLKIESFIKKLNRSKKHELILNPDCLNDLLPNIDVIKINPIKAPYQQG